VFGLGPATQVCLAVGATDLRKGFEGLFGLVKDRLGLEPLSGHVICFCNRSRSRIKLLFWDGSGLWCCGKRLERGRFKCPVDCDGPMRMRLSQEEPTLLLEAGPRVAAIVSIIESCRRLSIPIRQYLGSVLPGLADRPISQTAELTPAARANRNPSAKPPPSSVV
jgi:transposase